MTSIKNIVVFIACVGFFIFSVYVFGSYARKDQADYECKIHTT